MEILIPLKAKYRLPGRLLRRSGIDPPEGTRVYSGGRFAAKPRTNSGKAKQGQIVSCRMKSYWGNVAR